MRTPAVRLNETGWGHSLNSPDTHALSGQMATEQIIILFVQIGLIIAVARALGLFFKVIRQPQVLGQMIAGILLGPSLLGWAAPGVYGWVFPAGSWDVLSVLSQIGAVFFLFLVGLELDPRLVVSRPKSSTWIGIASVAGPFALGVGLASFLYPRWFEPAGIAWPAAAMFMGAAISVTAFPVLARILTERNLHRTELGMVSIACGAFNDIAAWCLLAFVAAAAQVQSGWAAVRIGGLAAAYVAAMFFAARPLLRRIEVVYERQGRMSQSVVSIIFLSILGSALASHWIGIHALFGAFLTGYIMPKGAPFVRHVSEKLEDFTVVLMLPVFFAYAGLRTDIGLLAGSGPWMDAGIIVAVACGGKILTSLFAARFTGMPWRESAALGVLLNTRGLTQLIILDIGLRAGLITPGLFAVLVLMAIAATLMTAPLLHWIYPLRLLGALGTTTSTRPRRGMSILIPVSLPKSGGPLVQIADMLIGDEKLDSRLIAMHLRRPADHDAYRSGLDEASVTHDEALAPLLAQARGRSIPVEPISFVSSDIPGDIAMVAKLNSADLVLMGFHKPVIGKTILGGTVHRVLAACATDVAIFVDRGFRMARRILVPFLGSNHDILAMVLAALMARNTEADVAVLHVVPPLRGDGGKDSSARVAMDRIFKEAGPNIRVALRVVEDESPVGVVLHQAQSADLVIIGVAEEWGLESHLFGWRPERIARDCPSSLLIVRKAAAIAGKAGEGVAESQGTQS